MCSFLPLNLILIPIRQINRINFWSRNNYLWKTPISHIIQNHWKKLALLRDLQFQFNSGKYPIRQLLPLKLLMDFQCIQASSSKSISVPNVPLWQKCQNDVCVAIWIWMSLLTYWNLNSSSKTLVPQWLLGFVLVYCSQKMKRYTFPKRFV